MNKKVFVIAEAGVNHNGDLNLAKKLIDVAVSAEVDAIKFQTWKTELLVTKDAEMADYQKINTKTEESQFDMLKRLELSFIDFIDLKNYCMKKDIIFMSTPDEEESATFLNTIQDRFKIGSGELTNIPFLKHIANFKKPVILSSGMGYLSEIELAINTLIETGLAKEDITILHATTDYPTAAEDVNLLSMNTIKQAFPGIKVGYSDHTLGIEIPIAAVALGANIIEKHFTLSKKMEGPDHSASLEPDELIQMVKAIRKIEMSLGNGWKCPTKSELKNRDVVRKSIVASKEIKKGQIISAEMLSIKRPGKGLSPANWNFVVGSIAKKAYKTGDLI